MKRSIFYIGFLLLLIIGVVFAQTSGYFLSIIVNNKILMKADAPLQLRDSAMFLYSPSDGNTTLASDGGLFLDMDDSLRFVLGSNTISITSVKLDTGANGANKDTLLIVLSTAASGGTADYDTISLPVSSGGY